MKAISKRGRYLRKLVGLASVLGAVGFILASATPSSASQNCRQKLNNKTFCCQYAASDGDFGSEDFVFSGTENPAFTLDAFSTTLECVCQGKDSVDDPESDKSENFICGNSQYGDATVGTATGTKIKKGQYNFDGDQARIYTCTVGACPSVTSAKTTRSER